MMQCRVNPQEKSWNDILCMHDIGRMSLESVLTNFCQHWRLSGLVITTSAASDQNQSIGECSCSFVEARQRSLAGVFQG